MALIEVVEIDEGVRIGLETESEEVQLLVYDEVEMTFDAFDSVMVPCCSACIEEQHWVELDGICPHGKLAYTRKVGLI